MYRIQLTAPEIPSGNSQVTRSGNFAYLSWGRDDKYPLFLNYLYVKSALHAGIINGKVLRMQSLLKSLPNELNNNLGGTLTVTELLQKCLFDLELKNAFAIKVKRNETFKNVIYEYVNIDKVRISEDGEYYCIIDYTKNKHTVIETLPNFFTTYADTSLAVFAFDAVSYYDYDENQFIYNYYPLPTYVGGIEAILTDIEISNFHYYEIVNDFLSGTHINFSNGVPETEEEKDAIIRRFRKNVQDKKKRGGIVVTFSNGKDTAPEINQLNGNNLDTRYLELSNDVQQRILTAHTVTSPLLFGIKTAGQLGGATELEAAEEIFNKNYIYPRFNKFIDFINQVIKGLQHEKIYITQQQQGIHESEIIQLIEQHGIDKSNVRRISDYIDFDKFDIDEMYKLLQFSESYLTEKQDRVLSLLIEGESVQRIIQITGYTVDDVYNTLRELQRLKAIDDEYIPTRKAKSMIKEEVMAVFYEYRVRPGMGDPIIPTTREFCKRMVKHTETKALTRKDIDLISQRVGRDVWYYRGGWYHNPTDGVNYPHCRHYWYQYIGVVNKKLL